jgi:hypothetical protein
VVEEQTLLYGLLAQQSETELTVVQGLVEAAKVGFPSKAILTTFTRTLTEALGRLHSFEATYYLIYYPAQTVQAMWVIHDRNRVDAVHTSFSKALQLKTASYMRYSVAACTKVRELASTMQRLNDTVQELCTVTKTVDGKHAAPHVSKGTLEAPQLATFVETVTLRAELICTNHQLEETHKLRFIIESVKMLYTILKNARNSGEPFNTLKKIVGDKLGDVAMVLPLPAAIFAASNVTGTAAVAGSLTALRLSIGLIDDKGRVQFEDFLSHFDHYVDTHVTLLSVRPTDAMLSEWLHQEITSVPSLVTVRQNDETMDNPTYERMLAFLMRQRDNQRERHTNKSSVRTDRVMMLKDRPFSLGSSSSDEEPQARLTPAKTRPVRPKEHVAQTADAAHVRAIYGRPVLSRVASNNNYRWTRVCNVCGKADMAGNCEGSPHCLMPNNNTYSKLERRDMRDSMDAVGTGVGKDWGCFKCKEKGHFARDCPTMSAAEKVARESDPMYLRALALRTKRLQELAAQPAPGSGRGRRAERGGNRPGDTDRQTDADAPRRDSEPPRDSQRTGESPRTTDNSRRDWDRGDRRRERDRNYRGQRSGREITADSRENGSWRKDAAPKNGTDGQARPRR